MAIGISKYDAFSSVVDQHMAWCYIWLLKTVI